jgi:hypothetical protein
MAHPNKVKGSNLERELAKTFREMGFPFCKTSRYGDKLTDDCKIDLVFCPFNVQAKAGYEKSRVKFDKLYGESMELLKVNFPPKHEIHTKPFVVVNKISGRYKETYQWIFAHKDIVPLLTDYYRLKQLEDDGKL